MICYIQLFVGRSQAAGVNTYRTNVFKVYILVHAEIQTGSVAAMTVMQNV